MKHATGTGQHTRRNSAELSRADLRTPPQSSRASSAKSRRLLTTQSAACTAQRADRPDSMRGTPGFFDAAADVQDDLHSRHISLVMAATCSTDRLQLLSAKLCH